MRTYFLITMLGCTMTRAEPPATCSDDEADAPSCLGVGRQAPISPNEGLQNVEGSTLTECSTKPMTGFFRDGSCRTGPRDRGVHVVCAAMTEDFLSFTKKRGNDLSTPAPQYGFPGLNPGDRWCLCAARWEEARQAGNAPPVILSATHEAAFRSTTLADLRAHAAP